MTVDNLPNLSAEETAARLAPVNKPPDTETPPADATKATSTSTSVKADGTPSSPSPDTKTAETKTETPSVKDEPKPDASLLKELKRLGGVVKSKQEAYSKLQADYQKLLDGTSDQTQTKQTKQTKQTTSEHEFEDEETEETPTSSKEIASLRKDIQTLAKLVGVSSREAQSLKEAAIEQEETTARRQADKLLIGTVQKFVGDLYPKDLDADGIKSQNRIVEGMARQYLLEMLEAEGDDADPMDVLTDENLQMMLQLVRKDYQTIGAQLAASQIKDNEEARRLNKTRPDGVVAVPAGKTLDDMTPEQQDAFLAAVEARHSGAAAS